MIMQDSNFRTNCSICINDACVNNLCKQLIINTDILDDVEMQLDWFYGKIYCNTLTNVSDPLKTERFLIQSFDVN